MKIRSKHEIIKEVNDGLWERFKDQLPEHLLTTEFDPCNDWGHLGFCIDYYEERTGRMLLIEVDDSPHHTYAKLDPGVRAVGFYEINDSQTMREGMWNIAWAIYLNLKKRDEKDVT